VRPALFRRIVEAAEPARVQASGGIRSVADARELLGAGAARVVVGTAAFEGDLAAFVGALGERLVVALDVRDGVVAIRGWTGTACTLDEAIERCRAAGVRRVLCTSIERDGTSAGPDLELVRRVAAAGIPVLAAGGVRDARDVDALMEAGAEAVIAGRAVLSGALAR
jgi:phosphoribosylformimino-5-aminoimidazole carboxamide ribotide isomerase